MPQIKPKEEVLKENQTAVYLITLYGDQMKSLTPEMDERFEREGRYEDLDELMNSIKSEKESKQQESRLYKIAATGLRKYALPIVMGGLVGLGAAEINDNPAVYESMLEGARSAGIVAATLGVTGYMWKRKLGKGIKKFAGNFWKGMKENLREQGKKGELKNSENIIKFLEMMGGGFKNMVQDPDTAAKNEVITYVKDYKPKDSSSGYFSILSGVWGAVKYSTVGLVFDVLTPGSLVSLDLAASAGAGNGIIQKAFNTHQNQEKEKEKKRYFPFIKDLSKEERGQLMGGLLKRWYGQKKDTNDSMIELKPGEYNVR